MKVEPHGNLRQEAQMSGNEVKNFPIAKPLRHSQVDFKGLWFKEDDIPLSSTASIFLLRLFHSFPMMQTRLLVSNSLGIPLAFSEAAFEYHVTRFTLSVLQR